MKRFPPETWSYSQCRRRMNYFIERSDFAFCPFYKKRTWREEWGRNCHRTWKARRRKSWVQAMKGSEMSQGAEGKVSIFLIYIQTCCLVNSGRWSEGAYRTWSFCDTGAQTHHILKISVNISKGNICSLIIGLLEVIYSKLLYSGSVSGHVLLLASLENMMARISQMCSNTHLDH